jgi:hypothetical protein
LFNHKQIGHGGGINGFSTQISRFPDDDAVVIVLSNNMAGNPGALARDLAATLFGEKVTLPGEEKIVPVDSKVLDRHVGTYDVGPLKITVTNETGHLDDPARRTSRSSKRCRCRKLNSRYVRLARHSTSS